MFQKPGILNVMYRIPYTRIQREWSVAVQLFGSL